MLLFDTSSIKSLLINGLGLNTIIPLLPSLKELALRGSFAAPIDGEKFTNIPLKKLSLRAMNIGSEEVYLPLMEAIKNNLEELDIEGHFPPEFFKYIFMNLPKLVLLKIDVNVAPNDKTFYQQLPTNRKIKTLILSDRNCGFSPSSDIEGRIQGIIGNSPNIDTLRINFRTSNELMTFININLRELRILQASLNDNFEGLKFSALQELHISQQLSIRSIDEWKKFIESFPNIKNLSMDLFIFSRTFESEEFGSNYNFKNLEQISISNSSISKDFVSGILRHCDKLKCFKINRASFRDNVVGEKSIESIFGPDPRIVIMEKVDSRMSIDFDLWSTEKDYHLFESDDFHLFDSDSENDFDDEFDDDMDFDEGDDGYDQDVDFLYQEEENSDNEFVGAFRPG